MKKVLISLLISIFFISCAKRSEYKTITLFMMGTFLEITLPMKDEEEFIEVKRIMQSLSDIVMKDSDAISSTQGEVEIDNFTYGLIKDEVIYFNKSNGRFNSTIITISSLYGFPDKEKQLPDNATLEKVRKKALGGRVKYREDKGRYFADSNGLLVDFGAFAKGAIVDEAVKYLRSKGIKDFIINAGGDLYVAGLKSGKMWNVGVADPKHEKRYLVNLKLSDKAVATSGIYERYFITLYGEHISHLFDGKTGRTADRYKSVTVTAGNTKQADALSTIYFFMSEEEVSKSCITEQVQVLIINNDDDRIYFCE